jgi:hypothetical protein
MEPWREVWRSGVSPQLSTPGLEALKVALETDDPRLLQGATTSPPPLQFVADWKPEAACVIGYAGWQGDGLETIEAVEEFFGRVCFAADQAMNEPAAVRWFLNPVDDWPREQMRRELLPEVERSLTQRAEKARAS